MVLAFLPATGFARIRQPICSRSGRFKEHLRMETDPQRLQRPANGASLRWGLTGLRRVRAWEVPHRPSPCPRPRAAKRPKLASRQARRRTRRVGFLPRRRKCGRWKARIRRWGSQCLLEIQALILLLRRRPCAWIGLLVFRRRGTSPSKLGPQSKVALAVEL